MKIKNLVWLLVLLVAVPLAGVIGFLVVMWHADDRQHGVVSVESLAAVAADNMERTIVDGRAILQLLASRSGAQLLHDSACDGSLEILRNANAMRSNIAIYDVNGRVVCSAVPRQDGTVVSVADTDWFWRTLREQKLIVSAPYVGRFTGFLTTVLAYPIHDGARPVGVVTLTLQLAKLRPFFGNEEKIPGATVTVINRDGFVMARQPETEWVGTSIRGTEVGQAALVAGSGTGIGTFANDVKVMFASAPISLPDWIAIATVPVDTVFAHSQAVSLGALVIAVVTLMLVSLIAIFINRAINGRIGKLTTTARAVTAGDGHARMAQTGLAEFTDVAQQFNAMLDSQETAQNRILKLNRMYAALSQTNHAITHVKNQDQLLRDVCKIAVANSEIVLAWIGFWDADAREIVPIVAEGPSADYLRTARRFRTAVEPSAELDGPIHACLAANKPFICTDVTTHPHFAIKREQLRPHGFRSFAAFPLFRNGKSVGILSLYAKDAGYFDDDEILRLLAEMTSDLSYALDALHRRAQQRDTERRFAQIVDNIKEVFWLSDVETRKILYVSPAYREIWGRAEEDLYKSPRSWLESVHPDDRERVAAAATYKQITGEYDEDYRIVRPDGEVRWVNARAFPVRDEHGKVIRIAGVAEDITARKVAEEQQRQLELRLEGVLTSITDGCIVLDHKLDIKYVNPVAEQFLHCSRDDLLNRGLWDVLPHLSDSSFEDHLRAAIRTREVVRFEEHCVQYNAWYDAAIYPSAKSISIFFRDVTMAKATEARLFQAQKMEALGNLAGGIAHDFNNMLLPIVNLTEMTKDDLPPDHPVQDNLDLVIAAANRAGGLVKKILAFGRRNERKTQEVDISECVSGALDLLRNVLPARISLESDVVKSIGYVKGDPAELNSIILNMGVNAVHAMSGNGSLQISLSSVSLSADEGRKHTNLNAEQRYACLTVADTGHGMDAETIARIFDPFFTTKPVGEGTGLGLAMVHGTIEGLGGAIDVTSEVGVGTTFSIYLPLSVAAALAA